MRVIYTVFGHPFTRYNVVYIYFPAPQGDLMDTLSDLACFGIELMHPYQGYIKYVRNNGIIIDPLTGW